MAERQYEIGTAELDVLKVLQRITSKSYLEDNVMVTHTLIEIRDVEP